jgi:hypothetical protein
VWPEQRLLLSSQESENGSLKPVASLQESELHQETELNNSSSTHGNELLGSLGGSSGSDNVIDNENTGSGLDGSLLELEQVLTVFLLVGNLDSLSGELSGLADGDETGTDAEGQRGTEQESAGLQSDDDVDSGEGRGDGSGVCVKDVELQGADEGVVLDGGGKDGHNIFEEDSGGGKVRVLDKGFLEASGEGVELLNLFGGKSGGHGDDVVVVEVERVKSEGDARGGFKKKDAN